MCGCASGVIKMYYVKNLKDHKLEDIKMFFECRKFDSQGEIKSTEQIITSLDLKNKNKVLEKVN